MFVYVVEDDENMSDLECYTLTNNGYEVKPLYTAKEFEQELKKRIPDMIILDIMLPDENGIRMLVKLRQAESTRDAVLIRKHNIQNNHIRYSLLQFLFKFFCCI